MLAVCSALVLGFITLGAPIASAADITTGLTGVHTSINGPDEPRIGADQHFEIAYGACVPDAAEVGDSWTIQLPPELSRWPPSFQINDPQNSAVTWIEVTIADGVATYTLTAAGANESNMCFESRFTGVLANSVSVGEHILIARDSNGGELARKTVNVLPRPSVEPAMADYKSMWFMDQSNQCRVDTNECMTIMLSLRNQAANPVFLEDWADPNWRFNCDTMAAEYRDSATGEYVWTPAPDSTFTVLSCTPEHLRVQVDTSTTPATANYRLYLRADAVVPGGTGPVTYSNRATFDVAGDVVERTYDLTSTYVGGFATGAHIMLRKTDAAGFDANTTDEAVELADGSTGLVFTVVNNGTQDLTDITVSDDVTVGSGTVSDLECTFPGGSTGVSWAGPFASGASFTCTAQLSGVEGEHTDVASVTARGQGGEEVTDDDPYNARRSSQAVSVGDYVWLDTNRDGLQDPEEPGIASVTLRISRTDGQPVTGPTGGPYPDTTRVTTADGRYEFADLGALPPGVHYVVEVTDPDGYTPTTPNVGSDPARDSSTGSAESTDLTADGDSDNTLDFGFVQLDLLLTKRLITAETVLPGDEVEFELVPSNAGPVDALAGWSVTDVLPAGLSLVSMSGAGYTCDVATATCTNDEALAAGESGAPITVVARVAGDFSGTAKNVAYVSPVPGEAPETNPLEVPTTDTDTDASPTNNDAQASVTVSPLVSIGDYVWLDVNRDGLQSAGEPAVAGVQVVLRDAGGVEVGSTTTDADGFYSFGGLRPSTDYTLVFTAPDGSSWTVRDAGDDAADSDVDPATGEVAVVTPGTGANSLTTPDDPTFDAGLVRYNLVLAKSLTTSGTVLPGDEVEFELVPSNAGPVDALAGWSVTDVLPAGLSLVSMSGAGYTCDVATATCTNDEALAAGESGAPITVVARVAGDFSGTAKNVAYVSPSPDDGVETNPLEVPTTDTDTDASPTDNDAQAPVTVTDSDSRVDIVKKDEKGNDANTAAEAVLLNRGETGLSFTITNTGNEPLTDIRVSDRVVTGGEVTDLRCTFPDDSTGVNWDGTFEPGAQFTCTAQLSDVTGDHHDVAIVTAVGRYTGDEVGDDDPYHAKVPKKPSGLPTTGVAGLVLPLIGIAGPLLAGGGLMIARKRQRKG